MTDYEKGYRDGLIFVVQRICDRVLEVRWYQGLRKMIFNVFDDIEAELKRMRK